MRNQEQNNKPVNSKNKRFFSVTIDITDRCQMRCITCSKWRTPVAAAKTEMDTQSWKKAILKLKKQANCDLIFFSGGEPFLRSDIFKLIDFAESHGIETSAISNGFSLCGLAEKIIQSRLSSLKISLNGFMPDFHDFTRGVKGSFARAKEAVLKINRLRRNRDKRMGLSIEAILMPSSFSNVIRLIEWVKRQKIDGINFQILVDKDSFHSYYKTRALPVVEFKRIFSKIGFSNREREMLISLIERIVKKKNEGYPVNIPDLVYRLFLLKPAAVVDLIQCKAGKKSFFVDPYGDIRLCCNMSPIGSIKTMNLGNLLNSSQALKQRVAIKKCKKLCRILLCNV